MTNSASHSIVYDYLHRMSTAQGQAVSEMFTPDGVIDDYRGGHRVGREAIREFMDNRPSRNVDYLSDVIAEGPRLMVYTCMHYQDGRGDKTIRFIFTIREGLIEHLCNSEIEFLPKV